MALIYVLIGFIIGSFFPQPAFIRNIFTSIKNKFSGK